MMKWSACLFLLFLVSCSRNKVPKDILPGDKMEKVIWDMIQADQFYRENVVKDSVKTNLTQARYDLYNKVLQIHGLSKQTFEKSYAYYVDHPRLLKAMFDSLSTTGNKQLQDFYKTPVVDSSRVLKLKRGLDTLKMK
jgi:hypothetical protein